MKGFAGFPAGKQPYTPVPNLFFTELLPVIEHLSEIKYQIWIIFIITI